MATRLLIAGGYDSKNLGDHGMLRVFSRELRQRDPDTEIVLLSRHPDPCFDETYGVRSILNLDHETRAQSAGRWFRGLNPGDDTAHLHAIREELASSDLLVLGGGRMLIDITLGVFRGHLPYFAMLVTLAKFQGIPVMLFGQTISRNETDIGCELVKFIASNADAVTVREESSREELERLGVPSDSTSVLPDPALGLAHEDRLAQGHALLRAEGLDASAGTLIAMCVRAPQTLLRTRSSSNADSLFGDLARLCDWIVETLGAKVVFVPQQTYGVDNPLVDDRNVARAIRSLMSRSDAAVVLQAEHTVEEALAVYQACEMLVSTRRHGIVFAHTQRVPSVALSGDPNVEAYMRSVGQEANVITIEDMSHESTRERILAVWESRTEIRKYLEDKMPGLAAATAGYAKVALALVNRAA